MTIHLYCRKCISSEETQTSRKQGGQNSIRKDMGNWPTLKWTWFNVSFKKCFFMHRAALKVLWTSHCFLLWCQGNFNLVYDLKSDLFSCGIITFFRQIQWNSYYFLLSGQNGYSFPAALSVLNNLKKSEWILVVLCCCFVLLFCLFLYHKDYYL